MGGGSGSLRVNGAWIAWRVRGRFYGQNARGHQSVLFWGCNLAESGPAFTCKDSTSVSMSLRVDGAWIAWWMGGGSVCVSVCACGWCLDSLVEVLCLSLRVDGAWISW